MNKKTEAIFKLLGVEPDKPFKIGGAEESYVLDKKLKLKRIDDKGKHHDAGHELVNLLTEDVNIEHSLSLTDEEKAICAGFYAAGYRYLTRNITGHVYAHFELPIRLKISWGNGPVAMIDNEKCFSWLVWESEPYELKGGSADGQE